MIPYTTCSQYTVVVVTYDASSVPFAPLPLTFSTVDTEALFGVGISGSGTEAETILLSNRKRKSCVNVRQAPTIPYNV